MFLNVAVEEQEAKEAARRANSPRDRRGRKSFARKLRNPPSQILARQTFYALSLSRSPLFQSLQIMPVAFERPRRQALLDLHVRDVFLDQIAHTRKAEYRSQNPEFRINKVVFSVEDRKSACR